MSATQRDTETSRRRADQQQSNPAGPRGTLSDNDRDVAGQAAEPAQSEQTISALRGRIAALIAQRDRAQHSLGALLGSREWRVLQVLRRIRESLAPYGTRRARWCWHVADVLLRRPKHLRGQPRAYVTTADGQHVSPAAELQNILDQHPQRRGIVVYPPLIDWGWMKQRPHHLVAQFACAGYLTFFCPPQTRSDFVDLFTRVADRLYLCGCIEWLYELPDPIVLISKPQHYDAAMRFRRPTIIYDCLDDLSVHSPTGRVDDGARRKHRMLLQSAAVVCATAEQIHQEARQTRQDVLQSPNAADFDHFHLLDEPPPPEDLEPIVRQNKPIVGYYGALAEWFDFDLLHEAARRRPDYNFVLIGPDYDGALRAQQASRPENVLWLGEKHYDDLPAYLHYFSVATIPFRVNQITLATSPIKLFEYMAAGKPVVTTRLPECCRHECVLTADDAGQFAQRLDEALRLRDDPQHQRKLLQTARENSWEARFDALHQRLVPPDVQPFEHVLTRLPDSRGAVIFPSSIDWQVDLFQRPHHLARYFAREGFVVVYCGGQRDGRFDGVREIEPNLYVHRGPDEGLREIPDPLLWCFCYNFDQKDHFPSGTRVVYDLIDEPAVHPFARRLLRRNHRRALREATLVTYVAHALKRLLKSRSDALYLPNGVEDARFAVESLPVPEDEELARLQREGKPVAGYYGALAAWFDYDLLERVAQQRPDWNFLLIGPDYDQSISRHPLRRRPNVMWLGPRAYEDLPAYLGLFDVATIPFWINAITRATSPLKLYEYFAGGKPVITTPMPECRAFPEVHVVESPEEFSAALDDARAQGQDPAFRRRVREIARQNSWAQRVQTVAQRLQTLRGDERS